MPVPKDPAKRAAVEYAQLEQAARHLATGLAARATIAPAGTKWPSFTVPGEHEVYALVGFDGQTFCCGAATVEDARAVLATELLWHASTMGETGG